MGRKIYLGLLSLVIFLFTIPSYTSAHPGRTDSNGGHTCRTNCEKWGLEYGEYHYHNGGSSSGSSNGNGSGNSTNKGPSAPAQAPEVNNQALEEQRKQEELARQRAEEERKKAEEEARKRAEEEEKKRQEAIKERKLGEKEGAEIAKEDFDTAEKNDPDKHLDGKSSAYAEGFKKGYAASWKEKKEQKKYFQKGYEQGLDQEKIDLDDIPKKRHGIFEEGFKEGNEKREKEIEKQYKLGKKHGLKKQDPKPGNKDKKAFIAAYKKGYKSGIKETITKEGKKSAKTNYSVKIPKDYKENKDYSKWYEQGFDSNKKAAEVRKAGFKKGQKFFSTSWVPKKYKDYKALYKEAYSQGKSAK
ncbi:hypothetical protein J6TS1_00980 [Siminovitchia terrae]|uniref:YHYH domain-containing protein n=1 Tax=Siminovitchia terrae TaxID=1914933 RepID=A0A429X6Q0_SIMTE|nr:YHYH domain-containing protein [Siminovitchia terrae]RST59115.1 YHYH domain-containing protein [Siminovitchia terrae]GIN90262.1 hypothetical protein J22TS1_13130 [Siminovitchia terrae]GIN94228.1 hypothetical protein J6TS1_00980 [Siminovitchia terrae]